MRGGGGGGAEVGRDGERQVDREGGEERQREILLITQRILILREYMFISRGELASRKM